MKFLTKLRANASKCLLTLTTTINMALLSAGTAFASSKKPEADNLFWEVADPIVELIDDMFAPAMTIVVALGTLYCIILGVKFAKADEPQEHEKAKNHLKNAIIGFVLIFVLVAALKLSIDPLTQWMMDQG